MQIKTLTTGPNAGTTYYVDNNGKFMRLATHSNPAVNVEAFNESKGYTTPAPATPEAGPQMQIKDVSPTIKVDYVGPDGTFTAAPAQPAAPVDTTVSGTIEAPASGTMKDPLPPAAPATPASATLIPNPNNDTAIAYHNAVLQNPDAYSASDKFFAQQYLQASQTSAAETPASGAGAVEANPDSNKTQSNIVKTDPKTGIQYYVDESGAFVGIKDEIDGTGIYAGQRTDADGNIIRVDQATGMEYKVNPDGSFGGLLDTTGTGTDTTGTGTDTTGTGTTGTTGTLPTGGTSADVATPVSKTPITDAQFQEGKIASTEGQITAPIKPDVETATAQTAAKPDSIDVETYDAKKAQDTLQTEIDKVTAAQQDDLTQEAAGATRTGELQQLGEDAAQLVGATTVTTPDDLTSVQTTAEVQGDLLNKNISSVDQTQIENAISKTAAATATPSEQATIQGQLAQLTANFDATNPPAWAAGALRAANQEMASRGLSSSSMAGQAVIQALMESALPIAQMDASTFAQFEIQNLSNRQQVAMAASQQRAKFLELDFNQDFQMRVANAARIADIANINFSADQQIALENARMAQTVDLANLSNKQAKVMSDAAALTQLDLTELNNAQQAAITNAKSFLQLDLSNLNNEQQTSLFKAQAIQQAILSDTAAQNAALQFNASSENQVNMYMSNLAADISKFNADQQNAIERFNAGEENAINKWYAELEAKVDQFNSTNGLVIAQANAAWRQAVTTANNVTDNEANRINAKTMNEFTRAQIDEYWQATRDAIAYAYASAESEKDRLNAIFLAELAADKIQEAEANTARKSVFLKVASAIIGKIFPS